LMLAATGALSQMLLDKAPILSVQVVAFGS